MDHNLEHDVETFQISFDSHLNTSLCQEYVYAIQRPSILMEREISQDEIALVEENVCTHLSPTEYLLCRWMNFYSFLVSIRAGQTGLN